MGSITGKGADCLPEGTLIDTENGLIDIKELHEMKDKPKVLSLSHLSNKLSYNVIKASREIKANENNNQNRKWEYTYLNPDHRHYEFGRGYKEAKDFKQGDYLAKTQHV